MADGLIPYQTLRANNIFGGGNPLGIQPIQAPQTDPITEYATRILPLIHGEQDRKETMNLRFANMMRARQMEDADNARQHPNIVFNPGINPLQAANLQLKQQQEEGRNERSNQGNDIKRDQLAEKTQFGQTENAIRKQAQDIAQFKATHPNAQIVAQKGGNYHIYDPAHPELGMQDTGLDTGTSTDAEKAALGFDNQFKLIQARGDQSRQTDAQRANENLTAIGARGDQSRETNAAKGKTIKPQSAADLKTQYFNKAQELKNNPTYSKYIDFGDKAGEFTIHPDTPQDMYHEINSQIYGAKAYAQPGQDAELPNESGDQQDNSQQPPLTSVASKYKVSVQ